MKKRGSRHRLFADLNSPVSLIRAAARSKLPPRLQRETAATINRFALHLGGVCRDAPIRTASGFDVLHIPPADLGSVVATGAAMLRGWPHCPRGWLLTGSTRCAQTSRPTRTCRAAQPKAETEEQVALMLETFPDLTVHYSGMFASEGLRYSALEVSRVLGTHSQSVTALRGWNGLRTSSLPGGGRALVQYDAEQVDSLAPLFRGAMPIESCPAKLGIPTYGVEQLCCVDLIDAETHPAVVATREWVPVVRASVERLRDKLHAAARTERLDAAAQVRETAGRTTEAVGRHLLGTARGIAPVLAGRQGAERRHDAGPPDRPGLVRRGGLRRRAVPRLPVRPPPPVSARSTRPN